MTGVNIRRVQYIRQQETLRTISEETGVPVSTLSYVSRGERDLPLKYKTPLSNYYRSRAYNRLRDVGLSSYQANRYRWHAPETVLGVENTMREKVQELTLGVLAAKARKEEGKLTAEYVLRNYASEAEKMIRALQKSPKTYEQIEKYGTPREDVEKQQEGLEYI